MSDTHTDDGELTIEKMRRAYSSLQDDYEAGLIVDLIHQRERAAKREVLEQINKELKNPEEYDRPELLEIMMNDDRLTERFRGIYQIGWMDCHRTIKHILSKLNDA